MRHLAAQKEAVSTLLSFTNKRKQRLFSRLDAQRCRQSLELHDALLETLNDAGDAAEELHTEIMAHISWGTGEATYRLTVLGGLCSVMIMINICVSLFEFSERGGFRNNY